MLFPTFPFLVFFTVVFAIYWLLPRHRLRMLWLLIASCYFYMSWNPWLISLIVFSASVDYLVALKLASSSSPSRRRFLLILSISANLGLLGFFKYMNFFLENAYGGLDRLGWRHSALFLQVALPLGISFYTFETISYITDVYKGRIAPVRNLLDYALYIMFFPHLVAGPIVRPRDFLPQLQRRKRLSWERLFLGSQFFVIGLFKKAIIADHLAVIVDPVFQDPGQFGSTATWLGVVGYAVQIYCDFSGYSDMAVGLAHTLGFKLPANFNMPYLAANITEFWRRWHISLSTWLRDYLYVPLGGNRGSRLATYRNLLLTMLLGGLWHGANWTFMAWGLFHGILLAAHRAFPFPSWMGKNRFIPIRVGTTFLCVCIGWVFFRAQSFGDAGLILARLFWPHGGAMLVAQSSGILAACLAAVAFGHFLSARIDLNTWGRRLPAPIVGTAMAVFWFLALFLMPEDSRAFIYFQF